MARKRVQYRFLTNYIDPVTGRERLGTGATGGCFHYYANVQNVIKFGMRHNTFPPGQYNIYSAPPGTGQYKFIMTAYKRV